MSVGQQLRSDRSILKQRSRFERRRIARGKHGQLVIGFLPFFRQQALQQRILDDRQIDSVKVALRGIRVDGIAVRDRP